jgi:hypothetical protein
MWPFDRKKKERTIKMRRILISSAIAGTAIVMTGAGIGIGYVVKKK